MPRPRTPARSRKSQPKTAAGKVLKRSATTFAGHIGSPASHGCVRLAPENAAKLYELVEAQGLPNTKVVLTGDVQVAMAHRRVR